MSQFTIDKKLVISAAMSAIAEVEIRRMKAVNTLIDEEMNSWFFPAKTREQAMKNLRSQRISGLATLFVAETTGYQTKSKAEMLINACSISKSDDVILDTEDASFVKEWMK